MTQVLPTGRDWLSVDEVLVLTGWSRRTVYGKIADGELAVKPGDLAANGRPQSLIAVASLPTDVQLRWWRAERGEQPAPPELVNLADYPESAQDEARRRLALVQRATEIAASGDDVATRLAALALECGTSRASLYRWMADYKRHGMAALVPKWGGLKGRFTAIPEALQQIIKQEYLRPERPTVTDVHRIVGAICHDAKLACPSVATINRYLKTIPRQLVIAERIGRQAYRAQAEPKIRRDYTDLAVGELWVGDHRELDVFVAGSDERGSKIFRPWLTAWLDARSRACVGWHLALVPNSHTIALALRAGILRFGIPQRLYIDNGKDYTAHYWGGKQLHSRRVEFDGNVRTILGAMAIGVSHAQPYTPWAKLIEPWFGHTLPAWERTLPGWCGRNNQDRPEKLVEEIKGGHLLTLEQLRERLAARIEDYHDTRHGELEQTPRSCWHGVEKHIPDARALDVILMKHKPAKVYQDGIRIFGLRYWHDALIPYLGRTLEIRYDPANIGAIVCCHERSFVCEAIHDKAFSSRLTEQEHAEIRRRRKAA